MRRRERRLGLGAVPRRRGNGSCAVVPRGADGSGRGRGTRAANAARLLLVCTGFALSTVSCATLREFAALRDVQFRFDRVSGVSLAGIPIGPDADYGSIGVANLARLASEVAEGRVPLEVTAHVAATNPADNSVTARMVSMGWTLFVDDKRTVSGTVSDPVAIAPGATADVPVAVALDLVEFWQGGARELFDVARGIAGGSAARPLRLELTPTIETSLGPISYPQPIVVRR